MEELDLSKELQEFYEKNKDNKIVLSKNEIHKKMNKRFSFNSYFLHNKFYEKYEIIFGLVNGLCFTKDKILQCGKSGLGSSQEFTYDFLPINILSVHPTFEYSISKSEGTHKILLNLKTYEEIFNKINTDLFEITSKFFKLKEEQIKKQERLKEEQRKEQERLKEEKRLKELQVSQTNVLSELDKDGNGEVDVIEGNDFNTLLKKHQKSIVEVDRNYVQQFVKVSSYLKTKKGNIQSIFNSIKDTPSQEVLNEYVEILKGEIHTYNLILFNSLNMIVSLVEDDMITFYEIHEMFDTINMFDSKHEKDISQKLTNIGDGLESLMYEIRDMGNQISNSIDELSYVTEESNQQLNEQLSEIDSTMKAGNLINAINTYQNYKINKNTKSLRG